MTGLLIRETDCLSFFSIISDDLIWYRLQWIASDVFAEKDLEREASQPHPYLEYNQRFILSLLDFRKHLISSPFHFLVPMRHLNCSEPTFKIGNTCQARYPIKPIPSCLSKKKNRTRRWKRTKHQTTQAHHQHGSFRLYK